MHKFIAGFLSIAVLVPAVLFSGKIVSANSILDQSATNELAASIETNPELNTDPSTDLVFSYPDRPRTQDSDFLEFVGEVYTGYSETIAGIYVDEDFALTVIQQPQTQPGFISTEEDTVTEFRLARDYGSIGLLAHNYLAGEKFFQLVLGETIYVVYGDGTAQEYSILDIESYQALTPNSPYSKFRNLEVDGEQLSAEDLFYRIYDQDDVLILQTCIEREGNESWGRLFIIAVPGEYTSAIPMEY